VDAIYGVLEEAVLLADGTALHRALQWPATGVAVATIILLLAGNWHKRRAHLANSS